MKLDCEKIKNILDMEIDDWHKEWLICGELLKISEDMGLSGPLGSKETYTLVRRR